MSTDTIQRPFALTPHGSRRRYRVTGCRCVACTRGASSGKIPDSLMWPFRWLERSFGQQLFDWYDEETIARWKADGLDDFEADRVCIHLGKFPHEVWPGYEAAGLDCGVYP